MILSSQFDYLVIYSVVLKIFVLETATGKFSVFIAHLACLDATSDVMGSNPNSERFSGMKK